MATHCQICGRVIQAKSGLIAHHGYRRPSQGWQTKSCMGARFRPYEVACDALPAAIRDCSSFIVRQQKRLQDMLANPPATLTYQRRDAWQSKAGPVQVFDRPADFDPLKHRPQYRMGYVFRFNQIRHGIERDIEASKETLAYLEKRLAEWPAHALLQEALAEDCREGSRFDADGFANFFPEEKPEHVTEAWRLYRAAHR